MDDVWVAGVLCDEEPSIVWDLDYFPVLKDLLLEIDPVFENSALWIDAIFGIGDIHANHLLH